MPVATRITTIQAVADRNRRSASELAPTSRDSRPRRFTGATSVLDNATMWRARKRPPALARRGQEIAEPPDGLDAIDSALLADSSNEYFDRIGIPVEILVVEVLDQLRARHHAAGVVHQIREQPIFMRGELYGGAVDADPSGAGVEAHRPAVELALRVAGRTAQQRADARQHLFEMERLGDVVVGPRVEPLDLLAPAIARGQDQHRHGAAGAAPILEHRNAVRLGQADVENHGVVGFGLADILAFLAVEGAVDHVARLGQRGRELAIEIGIVLDDEETQVRTLPRPAASPSQCASIMTPEAAFTLARVTLPSRASSVST